MKFLFTALHFANYRNFESVVRELGARGHHVHLLADGEESFGGKALVERLAAEYPTITWGFTPSPADESWFQVAQKLRFALDYVRFLDPQYAQATKLRLRNVERAPRIVRWLTSGIAGTIVGPRGLASVLKRLERMFPPSGAIEQFLAEQRPDVVLLTSLTFSRSLAMEQLKAARALGIPTAACIMSWDHLSSKALVHIQPDKTIVWNEVQKTEAIDMHGIPAESVVVTGAQCYDQWFDKRPVRSRDLFCRDVGLDPSRPFVLYVCSAMSPVPNPVEPAFVKEWIEAVRASSDPTLRTAGVLVRPHPERVREWAGISLDGLENVAVHGRTPIDSDAKADYFDSLYYSSAVVGLCTSVFLEAAIVGRPVMALTLPAYRMHQEGMAHFRYLLNIEGGLLLTAPNVPSHLEQLAGVVHDAPGRDERNRRFMTAFIRPRGLDVAATPVFVDAVERLARTERRAAAQRPVGEMPAMTRGLLAASTTRIGQWLLMDAVDDSRATSERESKAFKEKVLAEREAYRQQEQRERDQVVRTTRDERRAKEWRKWRRGLSARKQMARLMGGVKQLIGARHQ